MRDVCAVSGLALVVWGAYMIYPPAAPITAGLILLVAGVGGHILASR